MREYSGADRDIYGSQYNSNGSLLHGSVAINIDTSFEYYTSIAMDNAGNAVVAYAENVNGHDYGIYANRWSWNSSVVSSRITVHDAPGIGEYIPSVALAPTGGQFVVAYDTDNGAQITEMGSGHSQLATIGPFYISSGEFTSYDAYDAHVSIDGHDRYVVTYTVFDPSTNHDEILSERHFLT